MAKYLDRGPILQDGGGHLMLGLGDNIAHFVKKKCWVVREWPS